LRRAFKRDGFVQISPFLRDEDAAALRDHIADREDWRLVLNAGLNVYEIDRAGQAAMNAEERDRLDALVNRAAGSAFQYRFETIRVPDSAAQREARVTPLDRFATLLSEPPILDQLRTITGAGDIAFADAQATSYAPGHFLTAHDDDVEGKNRRAAYVFGLTRNWRAEYGGLLLFHDRRGAIERAVVPGFNVLTLFSVPRLHSVSYVTPFASGARLSVTGWLRAETESRG
jgi:Rps23 Pro-64 3,4-dihydroxylase Tpa1-like proline 4-hydroxylase